MAMRHTHVEVLAALKAAQDERRELAALLGFYADLYELWYRAIPLLPETRLWAPAVRRQRLEAGLHQVTFDQLGLDAMAFRPLVRDVAELLRRHDPAWEGDPADWMPEVIIAQAREVFDTWDTLTGPGSGAQSAAEGTLAIALALAPYLQRAAETILPGLDLAAWVWARCPVCGGQPNLALLDRERGGRSLLCSRCDGTWPYVRVGCPFCQSKEAQNYFPGEGGLYRLYVCPSCKRYLKTVDLRAARRQVNPVVERLLTVGMDLAALQEGHGHPAG